jgi:hypothetical protein
MNAVKLPVIAALLAASVYSTARADAVHDAFDRLRASPDPVGDLFERYYPECKNTPLSQMTRGDVERCNDAEHVTRLTTTNAEARKLLQSR